MIARGLARWAPLGLVVLSACAAEPREPAAATSPSVAPRPAASPSVASTPTAPPAPPASATAEGPQAPAPAPELAVAPSPVPPAAAPLGPFDLARPARTKLALIQRVDAALRAGDPAALGGAWLDAAAVAAHCPRTPGTATLEAEIAERRERAASSFAACLELTDWSKAEPLVLNYGSRVDDRDDVCPAWRRHESSELFYAVGDAIFKVSLRGAHAIPGGHALGGSIECRKKRGSAEEVRPPSRRLGQTCPGQPWPVLTQVRGPCPTLQ